MFSSIKKKKIKRRSPYIPSHVWSQDDILTIVKYCKNPRDKAILTIMFDMAGRNHEVTKLRIKDIVFKENYAEATISWDTKTGSRIVPLIASFPYVRDWINQHPFQRTPNAFVFLSHTTDKPLQPDSLWRITKDLQLRIKKLVEDNKVELEEKKVLENLLQKPWNPYLMGRHSSLTEKSSILPDHVWTRFGGLELNTKRRATYSHLSGKAVTDPLLAHHGIKQDDKKKPIQRACPNCALINTMESKICKHCNQILDLKTWDEMKKEEQRVNDKLDSINKKVQEQGQILKHFADMFVSNPHVFQNNDEGYVMAEVLEFMNEKNLHKKAMEKLNSLY